MLRRTLLANFAGQMVTAALGIVMVPIYVHHLGVEAYGLIAINAVVLAWVLVLDFGLSPTLCRELGSLRAGTGSKAEVGLLLESLEKLILGTSAILFVLSIFVAPYFAERWLNASTLPPGVIRTAFVLMMLTAIARWLGALYRGGVVGIDRQVALNGIVITFAVIRTVLVVPIIMIWPRIEYFFIWQLLAIVAEAVAMRTLLGRTIDIPFVSTRFSWKVLSSRAKLSLSIALATVIWACTTQIDKIVLSKILPLADFAVFSLATLLASGILLLANPIQQAFIPRLTTESFGGGERIRQMYALATELTSLAVLPVAAVFFCAPEAVLRFWSASAPVSPDALRTMQCYAAGNAFSAIASLAFIVQYAKGNLSLHLKGNIGFLFLYAPAVLFGGMHFGAVGAAYAWMAMNFLLLFGWVAIVHRKFIPGINASWYRSLITRIVALAPVGLVLSRVDLTSYPRIGLFFVLSGAWLAMAALTIAVSPIVQQKARRLAGRLILNRESSMDTNLHPPVQEQEAPVLSVIVLCYRQGEYVGPCLQSVLDQQVDVPFEVIVGDDNSPDNSLDVIESFRLRYPDVIKVVSHDTNVGFAANFADTVALAKGEYIANIDGDDLMSPHKLQRQLDFLRAHPECGLVVHKMRTVDQDTLEPVSYPLPRRKPETFDAEYLIKNGPYFFHSSEMYRAHLRHRSPVDMGLKSVCDLAHLVQVVFGSQGAYLDEELGLYRVNRTGMTSTRINNPERHRENMNDMIQTCQIAADLGMANGAVNRGRARFYQTSAIFYLEHAREDNFEDCIESSWRSAKIGLKQLLLYSMRRWPRALRTVYTRLKQMAGRQRINA